MEPFTGFQALVAHTSSYDFCNKFDLPGLLIGLMTVTKVIILVYWIFIHVLFNPIHYELYFVNYFCYICLVKWGSCPLEFFLNSMKCSITTVLHYQTLFL